MTTRAGLSHIHHRTRYTTGCTNSAHHHFLLIVMAHKCLGCHKTYSSNRRLSSHLPQCRPYQIRRRNGLRRQDNITEIDNIPTDVEITESFDNEAGPSNIPEIPSSPRAPAAELPTHEPVSLLLCSKLFLYDYDFFSSALH